MDTDYFTPERRNELREEVKSLGFSEDVVLREERDCPVFGVTLNCAYPLPDPLRSRYEVFAAALQNLGSFAYVYPHRATHITIATFINCLRNRRPDRDRRAYLEQCAEDITHCLRQNQTAWLPTTGRAFAVVTQPPVLSRTAVILPFSDLAGAVAEIRTRLQSVLAARTALWNALKELGWTVPKIVHATVARFTASPPDLNACFSAFDAASSMLPTTRILINELFVTLETKPYMRKGTVVARFPLGTG